MLSDLLKLLNMEYFIKRRKKLRSSFIWGVQIFIIGNNLSENIIFGFVGKFLLIEIFASLLLCEIVKYI